MRIGDLTATLLDKKEGQTLDEFITEVELILGSLGAEKIMSTGQKFRIYQIPNKGGLVGQFGDPISIIARNMSVETNASIGYLGMTTETMTQITSAFANAKYQKKN